MSPSNYELRFTTSDFEVRSLAKGFKFRGYAAVFNVLSEDLGGFVERVAPGAFKKTIKEADVRALFNHDPSVVLGRNTAGTLRMTEDSHGLDYEVDAPDTQAARDLATSMERRDIDQSSFGFEAKKDHWELSEQDYPQRSLLEVRLFDVSPVTFPAYPTATSGVAVRSLVSKLGLDPDTADQLDLRALINGEARSDSHDNDQDAPGETHVPDLSAMRRLIDSKDMPAALKARLGRTNST